MSSQSISLYNLLAKKKLFTKTVNFDLKRIKLALTKLDNPEKKLKNVINVIGSDGKYSVLNSLKYFIEENNQTTSAYISPSLKDIRERFWMGSDYLSYKDIKRSIRKIENLKIKLTIFEVLTLIYIINASEHNNDYNLVEAGALFAKDTTNIFDWPLIQVVVNINKQHLNFVKKKTITEIIFQKVGFLSNFTNIYIGKQNPANEKKIKFFLKKNISRKIYSNNWKLIKKKKNYFFEDNKNKQPNLKFLRSASKTVAKYLKKNDIVIYESTVYPGCTEEICVPILEKFSGLSFNKDFFCGYSPERVNPGDKKRGLSQIIKVTSGSNEKTADIVDKLYKSIITAGTFKAKSIVVAEAAKVIENTQRDLNIALMNELALIFREMDINTRDVLKAANTKWNFLDFKPGLVGGHCIGVDPYYLTYQAKKKGFNPNVILSGRRINDEMGRNIASIISSEMKLRKIKIKNSQILVMGFTFKENCPDIRNTKVLDLINGLEDLGAKISVFDPIASEVDANELYKINLKNDLCFEKKFHAIIFAVEHKKIKDLTYKQIQKLMIKNGFIYDVKNTFENNIINANL